MKVVLYTTHCPKCMVLEKKMATKGIVYEIVTDTSLMIKKGFHLELRQLDKKE